MIPELWPQAPARLDALAREILDLLRGHAEASSIVLGGGVALQHYCEFRDTHDLDAWWFAAPEPGAEALLTRVVDEVGSRQGLSVRVRRFGDTQSYELQREGKTVFSFQIAVRDVALGPALASAWAPVRIETFEDNLASKMTALVNRGAPRDFVDVHEVSRRGLATPSELWSVWSRKHLDHSRDDARLAVLRHLELIERRRPLDRIVDDAARRSASEVREWTRTTLCPERDA